MALQETFARTPQPQGAFDAAAFEADLVKHMSFLRAFAVSLCGKQLAEDLVQSALAKAWCARQSFMVGSNFKAWLFVILRNEYYSHRRRSWRQTAWDVKFEETLNAPHGEQHWAAELSDTTCAIRSLPDVQRDALILVGVGGYSYDDAGALAKVAPGTMKSRVARGRQALREILGSQQALPAKSRPAKGGAMNEILAQLGGLSGVRAKRADMMHAGA